MPLKQRFIASEIYWFSIPRVKCGGRAANGDSLGSSPEISIPENLSPGSAHTKYTSNIMDTVHSHLFAIAAKDARSVAPEDDQIETPFLVPCGLKCFGSTNSSVVSLLSS